MSTCALDTSAVITTLERLHSAARGDWKHRVRTAPRWILSRATGRDFMSKSPHALAKTYSAVTAEQGRFLYLLARASRAKRIFEFGCSFGISTVYLAAAARENGGVVVTTEVAPKKIIGARENLCLAELSEVVTILEGDALETLRHDTGSVDLLFLDGMKHLYLPVLELLRPRLTPGAIVVADNADMPSGRPYVDMVRSKQSGFVSVSLFGGRVELSSLCR